MTQIRLGNPDDFAAVMERVLTSFRERNPVHLRFEELQPDTVCPQTMPQWRLALVDGQVAAGMHLVPRQLVAARDVRVPAMGLANVFCYPPFRKRGLMSALLERCVADMERDHNAICLLGGERTRYGNYGWEHAGSDRALTLAAGVTRFESSLPVSAMDFRAWTGDSGDVTRMLEAYSALAYRTERTAAEFARVLQRPGQVVWICDRAEEGFGYVSVRGNTICEYAGDVGAVTMLLGYLLQTGSWSVALPPVEGEGPLEKLLLAHAQHYLVRPTGMIRIVSMLSVLQAYMPVLRYRLQAWEGDIALRSRDNGETVRISGKTGTISVEPADSGDTALELSRCELARLFFGPFPPDVGGWFRHSALRRLFPLPIHWHALSHV